MICMYNQETTMNEIGGTIPDYACSHCELNAALVCMCAIIVFRADLLVPLSLANTDLALNQFLILL